LRFLAHKLELDERQVGELAKILDELKTERAQAEVDRRRTLSAFADAVSGEAFNQTRAAEGAGLRVSSAERLRDRELRARGTRGGWGPGLAPRSGRALRGRARRGRG